MQDIPEKNHIFPRERMRHYLHEFFHVADSHGIEVFTLIHMIAHLSEALDNQNSSDTELSGARWRLMLRLLAEEKRVSSKGVTPTMLSESQRVSKNTISALLRGLEEQGLIEREMDTQDYRVFRIRLTEAGRKLILASGPRRIESLNSLASGLTREECEQLTLLLEKLAQPLFQQMFKTRLKEETLEN